MWVVWSTNALPTLPKHTAREKDKFMSKDKLVYLINKHESLVCTIVFSSAVNNITHIQIEGADKAGNFMSSNSILILQHQVSMNHEENKIT